MDILIYFIFAIFCFNLCTTVFSADQCEIATACVTDLSAEDCGPGEQLVPNSNIFGCCPSCQASSGTTPGTDCQEPYSCLEDGSFAPVQCKGDLFVGRCFCSDAKGNRIFGQMWRTEAADMTCACSRRRSDLEAAGRIDVTLHCTPTGDYEPLQCDDGLCWCAEPATGQPTATPIPEQDFRLLPCYSPSVHGEQYLRRCESIVHASALIRQEQMDHGTSFLGSPTTFCDYDGTYGAYQIQNGIAYCTGTDGSILGSWQAVVSDMGNMNCNCARDSSLYYPLQGMEVSAACEGNGNYRPNQAAGDNYYCVDKDGYQVTEYASTWPSDLCQSYA